MRPTSIRDFYWQRYANVAPDAPAPEAERTFQQRIEATLAALPGSARRILDFGCGRGAATRLLTQAGHHVVGVDISEPVIELARASVPTATFAVIDSEKHLPFPDASFDVCLCTEVIEHLFDIQGFVGEIARLLVPDGLFILTTPYHGWIKNLFIISFTFDKHFNPTGGHIRFFSKRSLIQCLRAGGFQVETMQGVGRAWPLWKSMFIKARRRV
jgi:2-polyprenyl-6-hydroxyphenyl methylase/3-demethylubiquinone-9 3-methyltransferase